MSERTCRGCGKRFSPNSGNQSFCEPPCQRRTNRRAGRLQRTGQGFLIKTCRSCGDEFATEHPRRLYCRDECGGGRNGRFRSKMDDLGVAYYRDAKLRSYYGITAEDFERMSERQGDTCAVCGIPRTENRGLCVDHDHATGAVRGLLCVNCNRNVAVLESPTYPILVAYLEAHGAG